MRIPLVALGAITSCLWPTAALPNDYANAANLDARAGDVCKAVKVIVTLLKAKKATPFCSSFLGIPSARTSTTTATAFAEIVETSTSNVITEVPTYYTTVTLTTTRTTVTATTTITLQTPTYYFFTQTTLTLAPPPTQTVTSYYTPTAPGKRSPNNVARAELQERRAIPPYLQAYASSALSSACKCLSLTTPTPKTTVTTTTTVTSTSTTITTTTSTSYFSAAQLTFLTSTTSIARVIPFQPPAELTTLVQTRTTTSPAAPATETVSAAFPSQCRGIVANGQVFNDIASAGGDLVSYDVGGPPSELTRSLCCVRCLDTLNCMSFRVVAPSTCITYARLIPATHMGPATDQCPLGTGTEDFSNPVLDPASEGFSPGPCR